MAHTKATKRTNFIVMSPIENIKLRNCEITHISFYPPESKILQKGYWLRLSDGITKANIELCLPDHIIENTYVFNGNITYDHNKNFKNDHLYSLSHPKAFESRSPRSLKKEQHPSSLYDTFKTRHQQEELKESVDKNPVIFKVLATLEETVKTKANHEDLDFLNKDFNNKFKTLSNRLDEYRKEKSFTKSVQEER